jgi:hypothetical protein
VFNATSAAITFTTSLGVHSMPPQSTHSVTLPDTSGPWTGDWSVDTIAGAAGPAISGVRQAVYVDFLTRT